MLEIGSHMRVLTIFLVCLLPLVWARPVQARPKNKPEEPEIAARKACAEGDFRKGVSILVDLYVHSKVSTHIYNQARCYEQNHQWVSAIDRFREYLRKSPDLSSAETAETESHVAQCKRLLDEEQPKSAPSQGVLPPTVTPTPSIVSQPPPAPPPIQEPPTTITAPPSAVGPGSTLRTTGIVVGSVGLATVATAAILNLKANQLADAGDGSGQKSYRNGALACYGVGGAAVAAGVVMYLLGHNAVASNGWPATISSWMRFRRVSRERSGPVQEVPPVWKGDV
jgi:hypothetical protein